MLLMVGWCSCKFSESTQRVTHTIPSTLHSWIDAQHNTTHLPVASRVDCCLFAVTCRIKHIGHPCGNWLNWRSCFCALVAIPNTIPPNQSTSYKRRGPGYDGHDVCDVPFDSHEEMKEWRNDWRNKWMNEWMNEGINRCMNEWVNEWMNEWMKERMKEWKNGRMKE